MVRYTSDEDDDWVWGLVWRRTYPPTPLYWSVWVGWTPDKEQAFILTNNEVLRSAASGAFDDRLPIEKDGEWTPIYRRYPLYAERVIEVDDLVDC